MHKSFVKKFVIAALTLVAMALTPGALAQVVSSGINGTVTDTSGASVSGATVTVVHTPTNTTFNAISRDNGRFLFRGLPVGGPYRITTNADGFQSQTVNEVYTVLGEDIAVSVTLRKDIVTLDAFVVSASAGDLDSNTTGAGTVINSARMMAQPSINRSFADLIRTNPYVTIRSGSALTALGQNNRYNSISVDGARINDQFGLNASGLQSFNNPFALEALEQFSVSLSPYSVDRSGFTGASVNAITKSGTNKFSGSAYYIYTDAGYQGRDVGGTTIGTRPINEEETYGFTLGGPIIKDRLFFFANYEKYTREAAATNPGFIPNAAEAAAINARLAAINTAIGSKAVDFGTLGGSGANLTEDEKRLIKLDWNINSDHRMAVRYSDTVGTQPSFGAFNTSSFSGGAPLSGAPSIGRGTAYSSNFYSVEREEKVWAGQIFSNWTPDLKSEISYNETSYKQDSIPRVIFPEVRIYNVPGVRTDTGAAINNGVIAFGTENSRHGNVLQVDTRNYSTKVDYLWRNYTFTAGFDREESSFYNLFRQSSYGIMGFNGTTNFTNDVPFAFYRTVVQQGFEAADISEFEQTGLFAQAKWEVSPRFNLTAGIRYDMIGSPIAPPENAAFKTAFGVTNAGTIDGTTRLAPRLSFNYAVDEKRLTQLRGGIGIFLGRAPWVFFSNSYGATGVGRFTQTTNPGSLVGYINNSFDPANPIGTVATAGTSSTINLMEDGLELPAVVRANLAVDHKLEGLGANLTLEVVRTDVLQALFIDNMNLRKTTVGADGRQRFAGGVSSGGANAVNAAFGNVLRLRNVDVGQSTYVSVALDRPMRRGWAWNVAYTHGQSEEAQALGSSTAGSQWQFNSVFNQNTVEVSTSDFEIRHRIQASLTKEFKYWRDLKTTVSLYYEGRSGSPYSYVYSNDLNNDGFTANDLVAVPRSLTDPRFDFSGLSAVQQAAYMDFFSSSGLARFADAGYAPRNSFRQPWQNRLDLRLTQQIRTWGNVNLELFADFINFGSWLSDDVFNYIETVSNPGNTGLTRRIGNASYNGAGVIVPTAANVTDAISINNGESRWRIQVGAKLLF